MTEEPKDTEPVIVQEQKPLFVVFCTPSLGRSFSVEYLMSAMSTQHLCFANSISQVWRSVGGDPYLAKVRNRMASEFLRNFPTATDLFFIDDDMGWPAEKVIEFLLRPEDIVVGAYPKKRDEPDFPIQLSVTDQKITTKGDLILTDLAPTGFMRVKRVVFERMAAESGIYTEQDEVLGEVECWDMFRMGYVDSSDMPGRGRWWGEDYFFSARWRNMGGQIWCDPTIPFTHRGGKVWSATFKDYLIDKGVLPKPEKKAA